MKPTFEINPQFIQNEEFFTDSFFKRFALRKAAKPLALTESISKDYLFPTLYGDVTCAIGIFHCDYKKAKALLPHPQMHPVRMTQGRSLVIFSCYQYRNILNVAPYNEVAMTIPVTIGDSPSIPVLPMIASSAFKNFGYYVFGMPVTSKENELRGRRIWGLPKTTQEIDIIQEQGDCVTKVRDSKGKIYFELRVPMSGKPTNFDVSGTLYSRLDQKLLRAETNFKGTFNVNKYMGELFKKGSKPDRPYLNFNDCSDECEFGTLLKSLEIESHPFQFRYAQSMNSAFDLPNEKPVFQFPHESLPQNPRVTIFGAGAVGASVGGWLAANYHQVSFYDLPQVQKTLNENGITLYQSDTPEQKEHVSVHTSGSLANSDIIILAVKTYSLETVAKQIREQVGDRPVIVALQNGIENQAILSKYFSKVIYGIVSYNAWIDSPGVVGFQKRGPLILGVTDPRLSGTLTSVCALLSRGVETIPTDHLQDAARSKMVVNLTNSFATLVGHRFKEISDFSLFQKLLTGLTYEGVQILKASGFHEVRLGGMPSWSIMTAAAKLPGWMTRPIFNKNVKKMVLNSMAQDIIQRGGTSSELESLNGYFISLADQHHLKAPYNRAVYSLCKEHFSRPDFHPLDVKEVWARVQQEYLK